MMLFDKSAPPFSVAHHLPPQSTKILSRLIFDRQSRAYVGDQTRFKDSMIEFYIFSSVETFVVGADAIEDTTPVQSACA